MDFKSLKSAQFLDQSIWGKLMKNVYGKNIELILTFKVCFTIVRFYVSLAPISERLSCTQS